MDSALDDAGNAEPDTGLSVPKSHLRAEREFSGRTGVHTITLTGASHSLANSDPGSGRHACSLPDVERCGSKLFIHGSFEEMTLVIESVVGCRMDVEEALRRAG